MTGGRDRGRLASILATAKGCVNGDAARIRRLAHGQDANAVTMALASWPADPPVIELRSPSPPMRSTCEAKTLRASPDHAAP